MLLKFILERKIQVYQCQAQIYSNYNGYLPLEGPKKWLQIPADHIEGAVYGGPIDFLWKPDWLLDEEMFGDTFHPIEVDLRNCWIDEEAESSLLAAFATEQQFRADEAARLAPQTVDQAVTPASLAPPEQAKIETVATVKPRKKQGAHWAEKRESLRQRMLEAALDTANARKANIWKNDGLIHVENGTTYFVSYLQEVGLPYGERDTVSGIIKDVNDALAARTFTAPAKPLPGSL
jgi:hypothetical protein